MFCSEGDGDILSVPALWGAPSATQSERGCQASPKPRPSQAAVSGLRGASWPGNRSWHSRRGQTAKHLLSSALKQLLASC